MLCEISITMSGFVKDTGTGNAILMIRMVSERAKEMQKYFNLCFINHIKASDKIGPKDLFEQIGKHDLFREDIKTIRNIF